MTEGVTRRQALAATAGLALAAGAGPARAAFPERQITVVVPFPPGGPNDIIGRLVGLAFERAFKAPAIIENRPGAGGALALGVSARATPDGYTVVLPSGVSYVTQPALLPDAPFKLDGFRAIAIAASGPSVLAVRSGFEATSVEKLVALAKSQPGVLTYGSSGVGTTLHLGGELFKRLAAVDIMHVPYKGTSEVVLDLAGGRIDMAFISPMNARKLADDGKILALATTGAARPKGWEQTPTVAEAGVAGYALDSWYPLLAPAATPDEAVRALNAALAEGLKAPEAQSRLADLGFTPRGDSVEASEAFIAAESRKWTDLIAQAKISAE
ncbi:Bug family tripartite tricarboxylate transporter substrate binding protein [Methylopila turkensis]|uniref:Tripartite tricarboxylate transporter substrate binding protein n=1 Tax=Methylopila turkensis TaxID=1437816 RepID=A0A9W6JK40_9HYPH|nr:tripartite tricarboxylate transporter substrate binding protein [Methylopila turkensis]GLK78677.1 hypothetical protein GCM10008174_04180 [Methylopila turkensis]